MRVWFDAMPILLSCILAPCYVYFLFLMSKQSNSAFCSYSCRLLIQKCLWILHSFSLLVILDELDQTDHFANVVKGMGSYHYGSFVV